MDLVQLLTGVFHGRRRRAVRLDEALELITRAVSADPENAAYLDSLGWVHYRLGSMDEAEFWLRRAIELNDGDGTVLAHLGEVLVAIGTNPWATIALGCGRPIAWSMVGQ